jgi:nicotinamide-nucleotide amidase
MDNINAEIITIGDEILIGQIVDTNSAWIAQQLNDIGINVYQMTSISDNKAHILSALDIAALNADLIVVTGGLGPTKDDITKQTIAQYFNSTCVRNQAVLEHITTLLTPRGIQISELNASQADIPDNCEVLHNALGTAPGMWFEKDERVFAFLPGVPFEMKYIVNEQLIPKLKTCFETPAIVHKTLMLTGIAESMLAQHIESWENQLPVRVKLAYLPSPGLMRLRLTAKGQAVEELNRIISDEINKLMPLISKWFYAFDNELIEETIGKLLKINNKTLATAESCTGGKIASMITSIAGSSAYFMGATVAYDNKIKENILKVDSQLIAQHGAVSKEVVEAMVGNCLSLFGTDYAVATSGIAGPDGGTPEKPVGTVWIAVASRNRLHSRKLSLGDSNRERNIVRSALTVLSDLHKEILSDVERNSKKD